MKYKDLRLMTPRAQSTLWGLGIRGDRDMPKMFQLTRHRLLGVRNCGTKTQNEILDYIISQSDERDPEPAAITEITAAAQFKMTKAQAELMIRYLCGYRNCKLCDEDDRGMCHTCVTKALIAASWDEQWRPSSPRR